MLKYIARVTYITIEGINVFFRFQKSKRSKAILVMFYLWNMCLDICSLQFKMMYQIIWHLYIHVLKNQLSFN